MGQYHPGTVGVHQRLEQRFRKYGISVHDYGRMRDRQQNACAICGEPSASAWGLVVDHDHHTGKVRGLLCSPCNKALGMMRDNAIRLRAAADYLDTTGTAPKAKDGLPLPTVADVVGPKRCTLCGYSARPERIRAGICRKCKVKRKRHLFATAETLPPAVLEREAGEQEWWVETDEYDVMAWRAERLQRSGER